MILQNNFSNFTIFNFESFLIVPELFISYTLLQLSLYSVSLPYLKKHSRKANSLILPDFSVIGFFIFYLSLMLMLNEDFFQNPDLTSSFNNIFINDHLSSISKTVICVAIAVFFSSSRFVKKDLSLLNSFEYTAFIIASGLGSLLLCSAGDLITAYLALELQSVSFYFMSCSKKNSIYSVESGLKYFIVGAFSSVFFLFGSSYIYLISGTLNFTELNILLTLLPLSEDHQIYISALNIGFLMVGFSLLVKLAAAPFHFWSLDVYESSPSSTTYFFAVIPKMGLFILLVRIFYLTNAILLFDFSTYCLAIAAVSIGFGSVGGLEQRKLKTLLAYSAISHTGYILLTFSTSTTTSIAMMFYYLIFYMISSFCFWFVFTFLKQKSIAYSAKINKEIGDFSMLSKSNPALSAVICLTMFSLAGIPPLIGFLIKFGAFFTLIQTSAYLIATVGILLSLMSTFYYLRFIKIIFFENKRAGKLYYPIKSDKALLLSAMALFLIVLFINPSLIYLWASKASLF